MSVKKLLFKLLVFSPEGRVFFWATALMHVALKMLLGLSAALYDQYGWHSLLAPPQSFALAAGDIGVCFLLTRIFDWVIPAARRRAVYTALLWVVWFFLGSNFIVHSYFKSFINRGLIAFNGAPLREIIDYAVAGANRYALTFIVLTAACAVWVSQFYPRLLTFVARPWLPVFGMLTDVLFMAYISQLNQGQVGFMALNPAYVFVTSYVFTWGSGVTPRATADQAKQFKDPAGPIWGRYDSGLDVTNLQRPGANVLFVLIESLPLEQTPLGGASGGLTVLSELAENGINFSNFRSVFPATSRSFLTYHCGIYPSVGLSTATSYVPSYNCESLVDVLKQAGYRTGFFTAPMFNYDNLGKSPVAQSYSLYRDFLTLKTAANALDAPAVPEETVVDALLDFVSSEKTRPFFATYFMFWNHAPYRLPHENISNLPPLERYHRTLSYLDKALREALRRLKEQGLAENTIVIVAADHGEGFALHHGNINHAGHIYEDDVKIPFLIHVPGLGRHSTARQGSNVDFAPTVSALLGLPTRPSWQGQDLLSAGFLPRPTLLYGRASFATMGMVDGNYKYIEYIGSGSTALYDLDRDPHEQTNLISQFPEQAKRYRSLITSWMPVVEQRSWAVSGF
ncbi:MAG TPA: sulfatase-like hydrolase/transferase [Polyangiaceae bacterium]|nr:sulfatase-like hydrolase/transferase [Polyangiaceae bacterium]